MVQQRRDEFRRVARLNGDGVIGKTFLEFAQHRRNDMLARRRAGAEPQPSAAPFAQLRQRFARGFHFLQNPLGVLQKLFARLGGHDFFAQPVQKATADVVFQRLHRVADARLGEVQLARGLRKAARAPSTQNARNCRLSRGAFMYESDSSFPSEITRSNHCARSGLVARCGLECAWRLRTAMK